MLYNDTRLIKIANSDNAILLNIAQYLQISLAKVPFKSCLIVWWFSFRKLIIQCQTYIVKKSAVVCLEALCMI